jgi:hypothetical protein
MSDKLTPAGLLKRRSPQGRMLQHLDQTIGGLQVLCDAHCTIYLYGSAVQILVWCER